MFKKIIIPLVVLTLLWLVTPIAESQGPATHSEDVPLLGTEDSSNTNDDNLNHAPTLTLTFSPSSGTGIEGAATETDPKGRKVMAVLWAWGNDKDGDPLKYTFYSSDGNVIGPHGDNWVMLPADATIGSYPIRVTVEDGRGGSATETAKFYVLSGNEQQGDQEGYPKGPAESPKSDNQVPIDSSQPADTTALYRWYNSAGVDHFYTTDSSGELAPTNGYKYEGITGYLWTTEGAPTNKRVRWGEHYYEAIYVVGGITWDEAKSAAENLGGYLVGIGSPAENKFVFSLIQDDKFWTWDGLNGEGPLVGGYRKPESKEPASGWVWVNGDKPFSYTNWGDGEPNNYKGIEDVTAFFGKGTTKGEKWNDVKRSFKSKGYIVEWD